MPLWLKIPLVVVAVIAGMALLSLRVRGNPQSRRRRRPSHRKKSSLS